VSRDFQIDFFKKAFDESKLIIYSYSEEASRPAVVTEKKPIISHSQRYFRVPFLKTGDHINNNNTGENMKVMVNNDMKVTFRLW
jgi:hypothetical protein